MDLKIQVGDTFLYIRAAILVRSVSGFLMERHSLGYYFTVGGKIHINEYSKDAIKREALEEIGMQVNNLDLLEVFENIYINLDDVKVHEICFVYETNDIFVDAIPENFAVVVANNFSRFEIKPARIGEMLKAKLKIV